MPPIGRRGSTKTLALIQMDQYEPAPLQRVQV